jgi:hypothetical protein
MVMSDVGAVVARNWADGMGWIRARMCIHITPAFQELVAYLLAESVAH